MIYLLYSNDYEVFLGENLLPESQVLIEPTQSILAACEEIGVPMTLFADLACLWRYRELGHSAFPDQVDQQLQAAIRRGHDVQAHVHPHWLETEITWGANGASRYQYDRSKFLLGNWCPTQDGRLYAFCLEIFKRASAYLTGLLTPIDSGYRCIAYRAGGYGIQPGTCDILAALEDAGFEIDSSIMPGMVELSKVNSIDFRNVPRAANYRLSRDTGLAAAPDGKIFEIPVVAGHVGMTTLLKSKFRRVLARLAGRRQPSGPRRGRSIQEQSDRPQGNRRLNSLLFHVKHAWRGYHSLELSKDPHLMLDTARQYIRRYAAPDRDLYLAFSCHSKLVASLEIEALKAFHHRMERIYGSSLKAITFQEAARLVRS